MPVRHDRQRPLWNLPVSPAESSGLNQPQALIGRRIGGKMEIREHLGGGGMGWVFSAYHHTLKKRVAIKVLKRMGDPLHAKRFEVEAHSASRLEHPNAVTILDFGEDGADRLVYLAMEFVEGQDLDRIIRNEAPMEARRSAAIMIQALAGLSSAHEAGVIHRDLKPANIMVTHRTNDDGQVEEFVKVCDFGLAKLLDPSGPGQGLTRRGMIVGTPDYMSPEQAVGDPVDGRTDVYAAGVILYEMLTGRRPFEAKDPGDVLLMHLNEVPRAPRARIASIPAELERIVLWAMEKHSDQRAASARELREALKRFLTRPAELNIEAMVDVGHLQAALQRADEPAPESVTDQHEVPLIAISSWDLSTPQSASGRDTLIDQPAQTRATPQEIPIPRRVPIADVPRTTTPDPASAPTQIGPPPSAPEVLAAPTLHSDAAPSPPAAFNYEGPHPFYLLDPSPRRIGPCAFETLQALVQDLAARPEGIQACVSTDAQAWVSLERYLELTSQVGLLATGVAPLGASATLQGRLDRVSACAMFASVARQRPTGRLVVQAPDRRTEIFLREGQPVRVRSSHPEEQTPTLLMSRGLVSEEALPALMHATLTTGTPIEQVLAGAVDVQVLRNALMKERLLHLMTLSEGSYGFEADGDTPQGTPFAASLLALLPNLAMRALPHEALEQALKPHYGTRLYQTAAADDLLDLMQATAAQRALAGQLHDGTLGDTLKMAAEDPQGILPFAYVLLETGALGASQS